MTTLLHPRRGPWTVASLALAALALQAAPALALSYCDAKNPCPADKQCFVQVCVPKASLCTADATCKGYQSCDLTCKVSSNGVVSSGGSADGGTVTIDAGSTSDGSSGGGDPPKPTDAGPAPMPDADTPPPMPECPKNQGVCIADKKKIAVQSGCEAACKVMGACGVLGGSSSSGGGGTEPPPATDAGSSGGSGGSGSADGGSSGGGTPIPGDAGSPEPIDAGVPSDVDSSGPASPEQVALCVQMCSLLKVGGYAVAEWKALEQCVADNAKSCTDVKSKCESVAKPIGAVLDNNEALEIDFLGLDFGQSSGGEGGGTPVKDSDASATSGNADASSSGGDSSLVYSPDGSQASSDSGSGGMPQLDAGATGGSDATAKDSATATGSGSGSAKSSDGGCTVGSRGGVGALTGLLMTLVTALAIARRRNLPQRG